MDENTTALTATTPDVENVPERGTISPVSENPAIPVPDADSKNELDLSRARWRQMMEQSSTAGTSVAIVSRTFFERVFTAFLALLAELKADIGPLNNLALVDANGNLFPTENEPEPTMHIPRSLYDAFAIQFGAVGLPVERFMIDDGSGPVLERFAPFFIVHTLGKANTTTRSTHARTVFLLSQTKTFSFLKDVISNHLFRTKPPKFRVWFVTSDNVEELPAVIPVSVFVNKVQHRKLVGPNVMDCTLQSQGIRLSRLHIVVEAVDKTTGKYPVDTFLASCQQDESQFLSGGNLGLSNLGNTCYMNLALQCLVHVPEINHYFLYGVYERELNRTNPLGNKGEVAVAFSNLLHQLFDSSTLSYVTPREFKYTIGRYSSMFHGYQQQDSQEFLSWLLDALHEDLNRIHNKPYTEKPELKDEDVDNVQAIVDLAHQCWLQHKQRNDLIIVDLFTGLYQSTLVCPECSKKSVTFDPFSDLTLPLPVNKKWYHEFSVVDLSGQSQPIRTLEVELSKSDNFDALVTYLSNFLQVPKHHLFLFEVFRNFFYKDFQDNSNRSKFLPVPELIGDNDNVVVYIIPHNPETDMILPVINVLEDDDKSYNVREPFGVPLFVVLDKESDTHSFGTIRHKVEQAVKILLSVDLESRYAELKGPKKHYSAADFPLIKKDDMMDSDEYDSDILLAHPTVGADYGFEIKFSEEHPKRFHFRLRHKLEAVVHIPHRRPQFDNLPTLASKLPKLKRDYYHYPEYAARHDYVVVGQEEKEQLQEQTEESLEVPLEEPLEEPLKEPMEPLKEPSEGPFSDRPLDDDTDSDSNWEHVNTLFSSVEMPPAESTAHSDVPSPESEKSDNHVQLVTANTTLVVDWDTDIYREFFQDHEAWENVPKISNPSLEENKRRLAMQQKATVSLYDCLRNFSTPEVLGDQDLWYCPRCKEHRRATKTIQLWSTGDILTIHLKRFQSARSFSDKINMVVDFPIEGLDMSEFVSSHGDNDLVYDLIAVDNHYGGLGGGHYTASVKNFRDDKWYYFNDGRVTPIDNPQEMVSGSAYLLFYKKRSPVAGGEAVAELLDEGRRGFEAKLLALRELQRQVLNEIHQYQQQEAKFESESDSDDLYGDKEDDNDDAKTEHRTTKKSRSLIAEQTMEFEFESQRKQRLISKDTDLLRSVNINMGYLSSVSNLPSPTGSSDDESGGERP